MLAAPSAAVTTQPCPPKSHGKAERPGQWGFASLVTGFATPADRGCVSLSHTGLRHSPVSRGCDMCTHLPVTVPGRGVASLVHASGRQRALRRGGQGLALRAAAPPGEFSLQRAAVLRRGPCGARSGQTSHMQRGTNAKPPSRGPAVSPR